MVEAAERLRVDEARVRAWLRQGRLIGVKPGGARLGWRIPEDEVNRLAAGAIGRQQVIDYSGPVVAFADGERLGKARATIVVSRDSGSGQWGWRGTLREENDHVLWALMHAERAELEVEGRGRGDIIVTRLTISDRGTAPAPFTGNGSSPLGPEPR